MAADAFRARSASGQQLATEILAWYTNLEAGWHTAAFKSVNVKNDGDQHLFSVEVELGRLNPEHVRVELYADGSLGESAVCQPMTRSNRVANISDRYWYVARVPSARSPADFTPRLVPMHPAVAIPLEAPLILWGDNLRSETT